MQEEVVPVETPTDEGTVETPVPEEQPIEETPEEKPSGLELKNRQLYERAKKAEAEARAAKAREEQLRKTVSKTLDVEDYIGISAALEGLDQREKEYLAEQHKLTGKPIKELRDDENFSLWQTAYRQKLEKEKSIKPSGTQPESDRPVTPQEALSSARSTKDKEEILKKMGLYKEPSQRADRTSIGY